MFSKTLWVSVFDRHKITLRIIQKHHHYPCLLGQKDPKATMRHACRRNNFAFIGVLVLVSCRLTTANDTIHHQKRDTQAIEHYDVLMLGNSYTYYNSGLDNQIQYLFDSTNYVSGQFDALTSGGLKLSDHALRWDGSILDTETFDYVILQDQSQIPSLPFTDPWYIASRDGAIILDERVEAAGAETIFFMTWGYRNGDTRNDWNSPDYLTMQANLERGYKEYAQSITTNTRVPYIAPVGLAFKAIYDDIVRQGGNPTDEGTLFHSLHQNDGSHPSKHGTYLAACVIYSTITGRSTIYMPDSLGIDDDTRLKLQFAADSVVFDQSLGYNYPWQNPPPPTASPTEIPTQSPTSSPVEPTSPTSPPVEPTSPTSPPTESDRNDFPVCLGYGGACEVASDCCSMRCVWNACKKSARPTKQKLSATAGRGGAAGRSRTSGYGGLRHRVRG